MSVSTWLHMCSQLKNSDGDVCTRRLEQLQQQIRHECERFGVRFTSGSMFKSAQTIIDAVLQPCPCCREQLHAELQRLIPRAVVDELCHARSLQGDGTWVPCGSHGSVNASGGLASTRQNLLVSLEAAADKIFSRILSAWNLRSPSGW